MIYCVIPTELSDELFDRLVDHYSSNPNVEVIVDRRTEDPRGHEGELSEAVAEQRLTRDRRRARPGTFPALHDPSAS